MDIFRNPYFEGLFLMNTRTKESKVMSQHFKH